MNTLSVAVEYGKRGELKELIELRNDLTKYLRQLRKLSKERGGLTTLDAKVMKEVHFEREVIRDYIGQVKRKGKITNF